jgi:hypothetical protein
VFTRKDWWQGPRFALFSGPPRQPLPGPPAVFLQRANLLARLGRQGEALEDAGEVLARTRSPDLALLRGRKEFRRLEALARERGSPPAPEIVGGEK